MGRLFLIDYDQNPDTGFFLCCTCYAHIALAGNLVFMTMPHNEGHFESAANLLIGGPEHYRRLGINTEAGVICNNCLGHLGWKYVEDEKEPLLCNEARIVLRLNVQSSPLSIKDQEEKAKRCEFVHGLFLSTIPVDN